MTEEGSATARVAARALRDMYVSLTNEGFSERQALIILGQVLSATVGKDDA